MTHMENENPGQPGARILAGAAILIVVAVVVAAVLADSRTRKFDAGTPEAAAQAYIQALFDGEEDEAHALLTPELQWQCDVDELARGLAFGAEVAIFDDVNVDGDRAEIIVVLDSGFSRETRLVLERRDGRWLIADAEWLLNRCF